MNGLGKVIAGAAFAALAVAACGGVSGVDDLFTGNGGAPGTTTTGSGSGSSSSGVATGGSGGASSTTSSSGAATTSSSSGSPTTSSSSGGATTSSSSSSSSSSGGTTAQVTCNNQPCNAGEVCCFNPTGPGDHCGQPGQCNDGWVQLSCNGPEDCPGGSCCATVDFNMQQPYQDIACQPSCDQDQLVLCSETNQSVCPPGTQCKQSMVLGAGYRVCIPTGG